MERFTILVTERYMSREVRNTWPENQLFVIDYQVLAGSVVATFSSYWEMPDTAIPQQ